MNNRRQKRNKKTQKGGYNLVNKNRYSNKEPIGLTFLEPHKYVTLKYYETHIRSDVTTVGSNQIYNLNSLYDPDRTGSGHQPYGFDQIASMYNRYRVLRTKYKMVFGASSMTYHVGVVLSNGLLSTPVVSQPTFESSLELPFSKSSIVCVNGIPKTFKGIISLNELNGTTKQEYLGDDRFQGTGSASPTEILVINCVAYNPNGSTNTYQTSTEIEYECEVFDPIVVSPSMSMKSTPDLLTAIISLKKENERLIQENQRNKKL
jgi:hypothetical protein